MTNYNDILVRLENAGYEAYVVGGAVRDELLGRTPKDYDLATSATPDQVVELFPAAKRIVSRSEAPVTIVNGIEVATFRKDQGSRQDATFEAGTLEDDANRRDFTINALYRTGAGEILDPTGLGLQDLETKTISFVGYADDRIEEDPVRILRAFTLLAKLPGSVFEGFTSLGLYKWSQLLEDVAVEQVGKELAKLLVAEDGRRVAYVLDTMLSYGILAYVMPDICSLDRVDQQTAHHQEGTVFTHTLMAVERTGPNLALRLAALYHDAGKLETQELKPNGGYSFHGHEQVSERIVNEVMLEWNFLPKATRDTVAWLVGNHMRIHNLPLMSRSKQALLVRHKDFDLLQDLAYADSIGRVPCAQGKYEAMLNAVLAFKDQDKTIDQLGLSGKELIRLGEAPGEVLGVKLRMLQDILNKKPHLGRQDLLAAVGIKDD